MKEEKKIDKFDRPPYVGLALNQIATRANSLKVLAQPSRVASSLIYPDGRRIWDKTI